MVSGRVDLLAEVLASLNHGFIIVDGAGRITRINPQALSFLGLPEQEVRGRRLTEIFPSTRLAEVFTGGRPLVGTTYRGLNRTLRISYFPLGEGEGGAVVVLEPAGSPPPCEEELPSRQDLIDLYEALLAELPLGLVVVDKEARVVYCNDNYRTLLGLDNRQVENRPVGKVIPFTRLPEVLSTGRPYLDADLEFQGQKLLVAEVPLKKGGEILGGVGRVVSQDTVASESIRDFRRRFEILENKLLLYKHELETLQQNRSPFAEAVRHHTCLNNKRRPNRQSLHRQSHGRIRRVGGSRPALFPGSSRRTNGRPGRGHRSRRPPLRPGRHGGYRLLPRCKPERAACGYRYPHQLFHFCYQVLSKDSNLTAKQA
ncbi:MAG TPA: hypothetical protein DEA73_08975 [Peptococcaceae bacterium]|nr:hypothetical protein [Peptococcaceae bacterium]